MPCPFDFSTLDFVPLDTEAAIKSLRISEKASDNGIADLCRFSQNGRADAPR